ncbi:adenosylcobinamide-GDP ribazoletransferase [Streptomyces sp. S12]|nr:adenosylcobinamide-GDP ribazoletransferase [Streptomyces sp. S12]
MPAPLSASPADGLRFAFGTLTVLPVRVTRWDRPAARAGMLCAPLAGLVVGAVAAAAGLLLLFLGSGAALAAVASVAVPAALTRGLHLDGLADTADGLGSRKPAEDALRIMKQSDIGPFGVITLVLVLAAQTAALARAYDDSWTRGALAAVVAGVVARLVMTGHTAAAHSLGADLGLTGLPPRVRALGLTGLTGAPDDLLDALEPAAGRDRRPLVAAAEPDEVWALVAPADAPAVLDAARAAAGSDGTARVLLGTETELTELHRSMPVLRRTLTALPAGTVRDLGADGARSPGAAPSLEPLLSYRRADLVPAVAAYLRHRGQWERAAADLGVHRNTLRYRIATATRLLGADLDDPDVASHLWLALRTGGLA